MFFKGLLLLIIYILGGILLENALGFTSPALFSFYGFTMALLVMIVSKHHYRTVKDT